MTTSDQNSRRARRGDDGGAGGRAPGERRRARRCCSTSHRRSRARGSSGRRKLKPDPFFTPATHTLVRTGGFDQDLASLSTCDWIIEAIVERLEIKQSLFERIEPHRRADAIVSSNTSGIPIAALAEGRSDGFRRHFLGTHFFNPPRYLRLVEVIPTPETDRAVVDTISAFADHRLGKGVVVAKDTPNFIANHLGLYGVMQIFRALATGEYTIEEIDAMTGPAIGRPKSATFRTMDIAGIDVLAHVARNLSERLESPEDRAMFTVPPLVDAMIARGWIGAKAGQGFYKKDASGEILTLDPATMEYRPKQPARLPALDAARSIEDVGERVHTLLKGQDKVGRFLRATLAPTLDYAGRVAPADRSRARRRRSGDAVGVRLGARAVRAPGHRLRRPPRCSAPRRPAGASSARTPARAWWTSATACCASSSTRR